MCRIDVNYLQLQLKLARLCLDGYYFERSIDLLEDLQQTDLPRSKSHLVQLLLAEVCLSWFLSHSLTFLFLFRRSSTANTQAYVKKRLFSDAISVICELARGMEDGPSGRRFSASDQRVGVGGSEASMSSSLRFFSSRLSSFLFFLISSSSQLVSCRSLCHRVGLSVLHPQC